MKTFSAAIVFLLCASATARFASDIGVDKQYPVTKVVTLLKDMQSQLEKEAEEDEEIYDKMACWCKTNDREKSMSVKEAEARIADLTTTIESTAAASARLKTEVANEEADLAKNNQALNQLIALREKQQAEFNGEEKDMLQSIKALDSAIVVLSKHHGGGGEAALATIRQLMQHQITTHEVLLQGTITPHQKRIVQGALLQAPGTKFRAYQPASSEIFGILRQMKETFESNLSDAQKEEIANAKAFEEQKAAKKDEIKAIRASLSSKQTQLAKSDETNAQSKEDLQDTQDSLTVDDKFLIDLKERCKATDQEWELRQKNRQDEISAIVQAIAILSDDAARDTFSKTLGGGLSSFVQKTSLRTSKHTDARRKAVQVLRGIADKTGKPELAGLAVAAQLDAFTKVKAAIDKMVKELLEQKKGEIAEKDFCVEELNKNELLNEKEVRKKSDEEMKISGLETTIKELTETLNTLNSEIAEMNVQIKRAGEDRELANKDFQATIADQRETQKLLNKAITVLKMVYTSQQAGAKKGALVQVSAKVGNHAPPPPPPGFSDYSRNAGGGGAVALLTQILGDARVLEAEATKDEQKAQETYEKMVRDTNAAIATKQSAIVNKSQDKAKAEQDLGNAKTDLEQYTKELANLDNRKQDLKLQCDFLLKNFDARQQARDEEVEALRQAKAILSGMDLDSL